MGRGTGRWAGAKLGRRLGVGLLLLSGAVLAQPGVSRPWQPMDDGAPAAADLRPSIQPEQMLRAGTDYRKTMAGVVVQIEQMLSEARLEKDLIKVNCLSDKLIQAKAILNVADKSFQDMQAAIRANNEGLSFDQYSRIAILNQNVQTLTIEADNCIGVDMSFVGAPRLDTITEGVPTSDPTQPDDPNKETDLPVVNRPPRASPFI